MKKIIALLLALTMVFALAACGQKAEPEATPEPTFPFDNDSTPFDVSTLTSDEVKNVKVGFIFLHDETSTYDLNFMNAAKQACENCGVDYVIKTNIPEGQECYDAAAELVDAGCNVVFADSFGHESFMIQAAKEFPDVQFCHATGTQAHSAGLANFHNAFATIFEGRYLGGVAAGMKLNQMIEEGKITADQAKIGYIGAYPYAEVK
nr:BMP family ABC transporter substrate-binding protein [Oscillospiraceae bacterium]